MRRLCLSFAVLALTACSSAETPSPGPIGPTGPPCSDARFAPNRYGIQCERLVDAEGRVVFLHGVNARVLGVFDVTFDDGRVALETIPDFDAADAASARAMGFNSLRLPINWSALEPKDGAGFDEAYLDRIEAVVARASAAGLSVLIDFHQDAYSKEIGEDGAPLWAISPPPTMLLEGPLTDLGARRTSKQVLDAFDTFFGDSAKGSELRARFEQAVAHVATRFAKKSGVVGIEAFNEPLSNDMTIDRLHDEVVKAVRAVDPDRLVFFEPNSIRNFTDDAPLATHAPWPGTVYSPHVYTLAFNGSAADRKSLTRDTLEPSNQNAVLEAKSWKAPLAITEFGYGPSDINADLYLSLESDIQDEIMASSFFWLWKEQSQGAWGLFDYDDVKKTWTPRDHVRKALQRVTPEAVAGWPTRFGYDRQKRVFALDFAGDPSVTAHTVLYVPPEDAFAKSFSVACDDREAPASRDPMTGLLEVDCNGPGSHRITVSAR